MADTETIAPDLAWDAGAFTVGPDGDLALATGVAALRQRLLLAMLTGAGEVPYFPDDGAGAAAGEGGPGQDGGALARRARVQAARDPDVVAVGDVFVRVGTDGVALVSLQVTTRAAPDAPQVLSLPLPVT